MKKRFKDDIEFARAHGFEGVMLPVYEEQESIYLESSYCTDALENMAFENGWSDFVVLDFTADSEKIVKINH